jgi:hypothetical protein
MTNEQFHELCENVLIPKLNEFLRPKLADIGETLESLSNSFLRIADRVDEIAIDLDRFDDAEDR